MILARSEQHLYSSNNMKVVKLKPVVKSYIWGGTYFQKFGKGAGFPLVSELWELSVRDGNSSIIDSGPYKGKNLNEVITSKDIGDVAKTFKYFPLLVKLIDAEDATSVQVHPNDEYAMKYENSFGKSEMWHVISADKGSGVYVGFKQDYSKEEIEKHLKDGTILDLLNFFEAKPGDTFVINPGIIHAVSKGVRFIEIQQNSDITYRLFDYNRVDANGNGRPLHIEKALENIDCHKYTSYSHGERVLADNEFFTVEAVDVDGELEITADGDSFKSFTSIKGDGMVDEIPFKQFDTFFLPHKQKCVVKGKCKLVISSVKSKK